MAGWNFRKSIKLGKLLRISLGGKSQGISVGIKGARVGVNTKRGLYSHLSIPGTGLYQRTYMKVSPKKQEMPYAPKTSKAKFCGQCGAPLVESAKFCSMCGTAV